MVLGLLCSSSRLLNFGLKEFSCTVVIALKTLSESIELECKHTESKV